MKLVSYLIDSLDTPWTHECENMNRSKNLNLEYLVL